MKKILLSAVAIMALGTAAQAQDMKFGVKAGVNFATISSDPEYGDIGMRTGLHIGGVAEFKLSETFSVQPELLYSMQGSEMDIMGEDFGTELDYLNLPIMAKYYVTESLSIEAGPQIGFLMSAKQDGDDVKDSYKGIDFGIGAGLAYDLPMGLFFQARYNLGLANIAEEAEEEGAVDVENKNNVFALSVGYKF